MTKKLTTKNGFFTILVCLMVLMFGTSSGKRIIRFFPKTSIRICCPQWTRLHLKNWQKQYEKNSEAILKFNGSVPKRRPLRARLLASTTTKLHPHSLPRRPILLYLLLKTVIRLLYRASLWIRSRQSENATRSVRFLNRTELIFPSRCPA